MATEKSDDGTEAPHVFQSGRLDGLVHLWLYDARTGEKSEVYMSSDHAEGFAPRLATAARTARRRFEEQNWKAI